MENSDRTTKTKTETRYEQFHTSKIHLHLFSPNDHPSPDRAQRGLSARIEMGQKTESKTNHTALYTPETHFGWIPQSHLSIRTHRNYSIFDFRKNLCAPLYALLKSGKATCTITSNYIHVQEKRRRNKCTNLTTKSRYLVEHPIRMSRSVMFTILFLLFFLFGSFGFTWAMLFDVGFFFSAASDAIHWTNVPHKFNDHVFNFSFIIFIFFFLFRRHSQLKWKENVPFVRFCFCCFQKDR